MFIGHFAVALAAKKAAPRVNFGTLVLAAQFVDLLWPILLFLGLEQVRIAPADTAFTPLAFVHYPYSHSLLMVALWGAIVGGGYGLIRRDVRGGVVLNGLVLSHWILDAASHRPDLPLVPGGTAMVGFGLWNSVEATVIVEGAMFCTGIWLYLRCAPATDRTGAPAFWLLIGFLSILYVTNMLSVPPSVGAVASGSLGLWLLVLWAYWIDRHRRPAAAA
jgi:hypothetical protein